ncbi:MAG: VCBS repeat-containing protein, partial [bacterium]|nr:VCBS repeat-containing protein [bacterium]
MATGGWFDGRQTTSTESVVAADIIGPDLAAAKAAATPPSVRFTDITEQAGIGFVHVNGAYGERLMPETIGSGAAFFDYDNDGDPDLLLVNSRYWEGHEGSDKPHQMLYRNDGAGRFTDVTEQVGLELTFFGMGAAVGDYDNDGWRDLFISAVGKNRLFHNEGGRFVEVTREAGVAGRKSDWSSSAAFVDYDADGDLDLFVVNYVKWSREIDLEIDFRLMGLGRAYGAPNHFVGTDSFLYRNDGTG